MGLEVRRVRPQPARNEPSLSYFDTRRLQFLDAHAIDVVMDVGANEGQFALNLRRCGYTGRIISFEPLPEAYARLREHAQGDARWEVINSAVGETDGCLEINVSETTDCSSFLDMSARHLMTYPNSGYVKKESVRLLKLDSVTSNLLRAGERAYLKIDVQGYELSVLRGATNLLKQVPMLEAEMCLTELYTGQSLIDAITGYLYQAGYDLAAVGEGGLEPDSGHTLWVDGIFVQRKRDPL